MGTTPAVNGLTPPDLAPEDYRRQAPESVILIENATSPGTFRPVEKVRWTRIGRTRDGEPDTATIMPALDVDDMGAAGSIGARHLAHVRQEFDPKLLVRILYPKADQGGLNDFPLFEGYPSQNAIDWQGEQQGIGVELIGRADDRMRYDPRCQITGRYVRKNRLAVWDLADPDLVLVRSAPADWSHAVVFNVNGLPNRSKEYYDFNVPCWGGLPFGDETPRRVPLFTDGVDREARYWSISDVLRYLAFFHFPIFVNLEDFWADVEAFADLLDVAGSDHFLAAMTRRVAAESTASVNVTEALELICDQAGLHHVRELSNLAGEWVHWWRVYASGVNLVDDSGRKMWQPTWRDVERDAPFMAEAGRTPADRAKDNADQQAELREDWTVVNPPIVLGGEKRYEVTALLLPGWLPFPASEAGDYHHYLNSDGAVGPLIGPGEIILGLPTDHIPVLDYVPEDQESIDAALEYWLRMRDGSTPAAYPDELCLQFHADHANHGTVADVGRKWILGESVFYTQRQRQHDGSLTGAENSMYERTYYATYRGQAHPWDDPYDLSALGIAGADEWAALPRRIERPIARNTDGTERDVSVQVRFTVDQGWEELPPSEFEVLGNEGGIRITTANLAEITPADGSDDDMIQAIIEQRFEVRVTGTIVGDGRLYDAVGGGSGARPMAQVFDHRGAYPHANRRGQNSAFNGEPVHVREPWLPADAVTPGEGVDSTAALEQKADELASRLGRATLAGSLDGFWPRFDVRIGDVLDRAPRLGLYYPRGAEVISIELSSGQAGQRTRLTLNDWHSEGGS